MAGTTEQLQRWMGDLSKSVPVVLYCAYCFHVGCKTAMKLRDAGFDAKYMDSGTLARRRSPRSRLALTLAEREEISRAVAAGHSIRSIASLLGRAPSTISREIQRNGGQQCYRASQADQAAWDKAQRPKTCKLVKNRSLASVVVGKLQSLWSPEQIAGWLKRTYPDEETHQVSHETIYRSLFIQARGALKKELLQHLRRTPVMRRSRHQTQKTANHGRITGTVSISERPATVEDRALPGHWECDLLFGDRNSQMATLVERHTRYVMLVKVAATDTETVINALIKNARKLPQELYQWHCQVDGFESTRVRDCVRIT